MNEKNNSNFLIGAVLGAVITYLFTTESGKKIKQNLVEQASELIGNLQDSLDEAQVKLETPKKEIEHQLENVKEKVEEIKGDVQSAASNIPKEIVHLQKKSRRFFFSKKPSHPQES